MCGIVGIFAFAGPPPHRDHWETLVNHLYHRGPDEGAWWSDGPFFLGHRRLSIIDLSGGEQPMATSDGRFVITFNGEIYNYRELREELADLGHIFSTDSDTEVLLYGYRQWKHELPQRLRGMFAFAIADRTESELFIARDRFGEKPLFYWKGDRYFAFASEMRPLLALPDLDRAIDVSALGEYLTLNFVPGTHTLVRGVFRLPQASWRCISGKSDRGAEYWHPPGKVERNRDSQAAVVSEWRARFDRAVRYTLVSDVPVGIFLSGGMDSALIAESAVRQGTISAAYFLDFEETSYSEYQAASEVATKLNLPLARTTLTTSDLKLFLELVEHGDDPLADSSALAVWKISELAARENKVVLGGEGGDELFGGYLTYRASLLHQRYIESLPKFVRDALATIGQQLPTSEHKVSFSYKLRRFLRATQLRTLQAHQSFNGTWLPDDVPRLLSPELGRTWLKSRNPAPRDAHEMNRGQLTLLDLQLADIRTYLPDDILTKVDRMSMAHGLEVRAPYLDYEFASWALALPERLKISANGELKHLPRVVAEGLFSEQIARRPKQGFSIPIHEWVRGPLRELVNDLLSDSSLKKLRLLNPAQVKKLLEEHNSRRRSYGFEIWGLLVLAAWHRARIEQRPVLKRRGELKQRMFELRPPTHHC